MEDEMNGIKSVMEKYIKNNIYKIFCAMVLFFAGVVLGLVLMLNSTAEVTQAVVQNIRTTCEAISSGGFDSGKVFGVAVFKHARNAAAILLGGVSLWLLPLVAAILVMCGLSCGYTTGFLALNFGVDGFLMGAAAAVVMIVAVAPVYIMMAVFAFNNATKRNRAGETSFAIYAAAFAVMFVVLVPAIAAEVMVVPEIVRIICARITA